jgi:hypothetical protein
MPITINDYPFLSQYSLLAVTGITATGSDAVTITNGFKFGTPAGTAVSPNIVPGTAQPFRKRLDQNTT